MRWLCAVAASVAVAVVGIQPETAAAGSTRVPVAQLKIMNYYPADAGWSLMWRNYSHAQTSRDFAAIRSLGANTVRVIVQPSAVGYPTVRQGMLARFHDILAEARSHGLAVQLTLFDWWDDYADIAGSQRWLHSLLVGEHHDRTIALVELKNELPLSQQALLWARLMLPIVSTELPGVPRTVSTTWSSALAGLTMQASLPDDVLDVHYYGDPRRAPAVLQAAVALAGGRPVIVGETGVSTAQVSESEQAAFFAEMVSAAAAAGIPTPAPWVLSDFSSRAVPPGGDRAMSQFRYGLRRLDGSWKPAAAIIRSAFTNPH
jgi:endo-1,4-beta-mannosidase